MEQLNSHVCHIDGKIGKTDKDMLFDICVRYGAASVAIAGSSTEGITFKVMAKDSSWDVIKPTLYGVFAGRIEFDVVVIEAEQYDTQN